MYSNTVSNIKMVCSHCGKEFSGGYWICGVFYCPMCASIINKNNAESERIRQLPYYNVSHGKDYANAIYQKPGTTAYATYAKWQIWAGWASNHDQRIEDAKCTNCGYESKLTAYSLKELPEFCAGCGALINGVIEV